MKHVLRLWIVLLAVVALVPFARSLDAPAENPLTIPEICTLLKSGSTSDDVLTSLKARRLLERPTAADEQTLRTAGATPHLVDALKNGTYTLDPFEAGAARKRLAASGETPGASSPNHVANLLRGKLVTFQNGGLKPYDDTKLAGKKYIAFYYSAHWCPPCRKFTPQFVKFYQQVASQHPELEVVFVSSDEGPAEMQNYMKIENMPWAALRFERKATEHEVTHYAGAGIPDLVVVDATGKVLSDSYQGKTYVGPYKVTNDLAKLINVPPPTFAD